MRNRSIVSTFLLLTLLLTLPLAAFSQDQLNTVYLPVVASGVGSADIARIHPQPFASNRLASVMTRNLYLGADLLPILGAQGPDAFVLAATNAYTMMLATDIPGRMDAIASEIATAQPLLVGLQEAALWRIAPSDPQTPATTVQYDFVQMLLAALARRGLQYEAIAVVLGSDAEVPTLLGIDVRLTLQDAILVRSDLKTADLKLSNLQTGHYSAALVIENPVMGTIIIPRQWAAVDVKIRGKQFRFVTTHLEPYSPLVRVAQAQELLNGALTTELPVLMLGDFNSQPGVSQDAAGILIAGGLNDLWQQTFPADPGFTCCQAPDLANPTSLLEQRIDLILARGGFALLDIQRVGEDPQTDKTTSGLWPSDHAGVVATVQLP